MCAKLGKLTVVAKVAGFIVLGVGVLSLGFGVIEHDELAIKTGMSCLILALTVLLGRWTVGAAAKTLKALAQTLNSLDAEEEEEIERGDN